MEKEIVVICHKCQRVYQRIESDKTKRLFGFCKPCSIKNVKTLIAQTRPRRRE